MTGDRWTVLRSRWTKRKLLLVAILAVVLPVGIAWAFWTADSTAGGNGGAAATTINQGATPTASAVGTTVTVTWPQSTMANGTPVSGYTVSRYDATTLVAQPIQTSCTGTITATSCVENGVSPGSWKYTVTPAIGTNWRGPETVKSSSVIVDVTAPTNAISLSGVTGDASKSGDVIYYRGAAGGSFTLTNAVNDSASGPASSATAALGGTATNWSHTPSTVSTPAAGPYVSAPFSWTAGTTTAPTEVVTGRDVAGNTVTTTLSFVNDSTAPTVGTVSYADGYQAGKSVTVTFTGATDGGSGIATGQLQRASAPLTNGSCGTFTGFLTVGPANPTSPYVDNLVTNGTCYQYRYAVTDKLGNQAVATNANVARVDYAGAVNTTVGALSQWRLGEPATSVISADSFSNGTTGAAITTRTGETGATWAHQAGTTTEVLTADKRVRHLAAGYSVDYTTATPANANYSVEADITVLSLVANDAAGVVGRLNTVTNSYYFARWESFDNSWDIGKVSNGTVSWLGSVVRPALTAGQVYRVRLEMSGTFITSLRLNVNGLQVVSVTDSTNALTAAGKAGIIDGDARYSVAKTDTTGLHLDNFQAMLATYPRAADSKGTNTGDYVNGVNMGVAGALGGDTNTAAQFDGVNDYVQAVGTTGIPVGASARSVEMWFKTSSANQQTLFNYGSLGTAQEFGLWLDAGGASMTAWGWGGGNDLMFPLAAAVNDGAWHQVVKTYNGSSLTLYVDGVALPSQVATRSTVMNAYGFTIGAVVTPGDSNSGRFFTGAIDEVSFYTTALNQTTVTNHYALGMSALGDVTGPTGGSVTATGLVGTDGRYATSAVLNLVLVKGTDPNGTAGTQLLRAGAPLTSGACGTYSGYVLVSGGTDAASPKSDTVADQACYRYQYVVYDTAGNATTYVSQDIKVDLTAPTTPTLAFSAFTNTSWNGSGTVYYRSGATSGGFTVTATATDPGSGVASYAFPALGTNWTSTAGAFGVRVYSWNGVPAAPGTATVTATNNAAGVSPGSSFTVVADDTAPSAGTVTYTGGIQASTTISVAYTTGTDDGSGLGTRLLQRASAPLSGTTCGTTYSGWTTITGGTNPVSSPVADTVTGGSCYKYQYVVTDGVGNQHIATSAAVVQVTASYYDMVLATGGLLNYYRLADAGGGSASAIQASDVMSGTNGTLLTARAPDIGGAWSYLSGGTANTIQIDTGRARRSGTGYAIDYVTATPSSANYSVQADLFVKSNLASDRVGVVARLDPTARTYYLARWEPEDSSWNIIKMAGDGSAGYLSYADAQGALTVGGTYQLRLEVSGTASTNLKLYVNNVLKVEANDTTSPYTAVGKAGYMDGDIGGFANKTSLTGLHFDNFLVTAPATTSVAADSKGTNNGQHFNGVTPGQSGALTQANNSMLYDGVDDYTSIPRTVSADMSIEFWFKSTQGLGVPGQWWSGAGLVDGDVSGTADDFGVSLSANGYVMAGVGNPDFTVTSALGGYNDGAWHHVVMTRSGTLGTLSLYIDGGPAVTGQGRTGALASSATVNFGRAATAGNYYQGNLDEVAIYNSVLPAATVTAHYNAR